MAFSPLAGPAMKLPSQPVSVVMQQKPDSYRSGPSYQAASGIANVRLKNKPNINLDAAFDKVKEELDEAREVQRRGGAASHILNKAVSDVVGMEDAIRGDLMEAERRAKEAEKVAIQSAAAKRVAEHAARVESRKTRSLYEARKAAEEAAADASAVASSAVAQAETEAARAEAAEAKAAAARKLAAEAEAVAAKVVSATAEKEKALQAAKSEASDALSARDEAAARAAAEEEEKEAEAAPERRGGARESKKEFEEGRQVVAERIGSLDDALEFTQDKLSRPSRLFSSSRTRRPMRRRRRWRRRRRRRRPSRRRPRRQRRRRRRRRLRRVRRRRREEPLPRRRRR